MATHKSRWPANVGLPLILIIGFGFGAFLFLHPASSETLASDQESSATSESHGEPGAEMPGMDMSAHGTEEVDAHGTEEVATHEMEKTPTENSPATLLLIFLGINLALIISSLILKMIKRKRKAVLDLPTPIAKFEGSTK